LKRELAKLHEENKSNVRHKMTERLNDDIKLQEIAIDAMRELLGSDREDEVNKWIKNKLTKGPARIRVLSREELKIEIRKFKNISLRLMKDYQKTTGKKLPSYVKGLQEEAEKPKDQQHGVGLKSETAS